MGCGETGATTSLGVLQGYVKNQGDAWRFTLKTLADYYAKASQWPILSAGEMPGGPLVSYLGQPFPGEARQRVGTYLDWAALLGRRTAELHLALASATEDPNFTPEPFSGTDQQAFVNSALQLLAANFDLLRRLKDGMPDHDPSISPPAGKTQPVRGFGLAWRTQPTVRDRLGWALSAEGQYDGFSQSDNQSAPKNTTYILTRDHQVAELNGDHTWNLIAVTIATPIPTPKH